MINNHADTIAAVATGQGGAIAVIRVSGPDAFKVCDTVFRPVSGKPLNLAKGYTVHYGRIVDGDETVDDVLVTVFRSPRSYTGEDMAEISCHGSGYIKGRIISLLTGAGARVAGAGEFTLRAFMAGKMDLSQAEAVADIIASEDRASHTLAMNQMKGGYSAGLRVLRGGLVELASLLELELDFSEEDVEFADRSRLITQIDSITAEIESLKESFLLNNSIKEGIPVTIAGEPNTGKSTLLNTLLREDRAMVSDIAGTTRDVIEESLVIDGVRFRFTDTAGLRETDDRLEGMGIERARNSIAKSRILLYVVSPDGKGSYPVDAALAGMAALRLGENTTVFLILNKSDMVGGRKVDPAAILRDVNSGDSGSYLTGSTETGSALKDSSKTTFIDTGSADIASAVKVDKILLISAKEGTGIDELTAALSGTVDRDSLFAGATIVTNFRHYEALLHSGQALERVRHGLETDLAADLVAGDIRDAIYHLGTITGEITNDEILGSIFSTFCIGK
ncbi:MAG: tRNA uridine-5-carboxymethylaminomethyl(34) synthesis GTPase MnmE [Rikenellaceae bacterium]|nr:tRNA uridine-5-carboxymethylaminomethyl(34) synthesis GTPase MnmE [Rikenellaceae bacterium]